jgi:alpha-ketoglutarate-dependent taurine dioxygenase
MTVSTNGSRADAFTITPLAAPLGAQVNGFEGASAASAAQILALKQALRDRHILIFKHQQLDALPRFNKIHGRIRNAARTSSKRVRAAHSLIQQTRPPSLMS